jgi:hypothetical protein
MHQATEFQFGRAVAEYASWRTVADDRRSPAASWWWSTALLAMSEPDVMPAEWCRSLELPEGSSYEAGAQRLLSALSGQTSLPWPDEFPLMPERAERDQA